MNQGDSVTISLSASDVVYGFYLDSHGLQQSVQPGSRQITFTADQPGKYRYRCSVSCGALHPFMIGELVVNADTPLWRAVAVSPPSPAFQANWRIKRGGAHTRRCKAWRCC